MPAPTFSIDQFLNIRSAGGASFSPDSRFVAFLTNITGVTQLWQVPVEGGWPTQLTFTPETVRGVAYCPTRYELLYSMDAGGNERNQLFVLNGTGGGMNHELGEGWTSTDISRDPKAIHTFGGWSHDGTRIVFSANRTKPDRFDIYTLSLSGGRKPLENAKSQRPEPRLLKEGPGGYFNPAGWSPDDQWLLVIRAESNFNQDLYVINAASGESKHLTPHEGNVQYESPKWSPDGKSVFCLSTHGGQDLTCFTEIDVASGKVKVLPPGQHELEAIEFSPMGRWLATMENADGQSKLAVREYRKNAGAGFMNKVLFPKDLPLGVISGLEFSPDETKLAFTFDGPKFNPDVWIWDLEQNKLRQLTHSSRAGIPFSSFVEPQLINYKTFDGKSIPAWYYAPSAPRSAGGSGLPPVIVYPHGGPESQTRPNFSGVFQYFLQAGYGILAPNVRGSSGYGTAFMNLDNTTKRMDSVKDLAHAVYWLRDEKKADPKRIAVYGGSYGGFMVLAGVTNYPDLFAAGIDVVGIANFVTFLENTGAYRRAHREAEYGNLREHADFLKEISPINHVDKIKCPMLVIHGANDPRVPVGEAEQIVAALKKRNVPVEYLRYEDEGHGLAKLKNRLDAYAKMVAFLDRYLK
jgi:dipeptidyl aminopeptidase/acylaminoacyl peptidase